MGLEGRGREVGGKVVGRMGDKVLWIKGGVVLSSLTGFMPRKVALPESFIGRDNIGRAGHSQLAAMTTPEVNNEERLDYHAAVKDLEVRSSH